MATIVSLYGEEIALRPFSLEEYHWLIDHGFFRAGERVELIHGALRLMSPKSPRHAACQSKILHELFAKVGNRAWIRAQGPITLPNSDSEPEADIVLAASREGGYFEHHPYPEDVLLVMEFADSSLQYDRNVKAPLYAAAGIAEYWLVNLQDDKIEAYREPTSLAQGASHYRQRSVLTAQDMVAPIQFPDCTFPVSELLPERG